MISLALILPAVHQVAGNVVAITLGHDVEPGNTYSVPLSASGDEPATHYGCRTWATPGFAAMLEIARTGVVPSGTHPELSDTALWVRAQWPDFMAALIVDARETDAAHVHWTDALAAAGLQVVHAAGAP